MGGLAAILVARGQHYHLIDRRRATGLGRVVPNPSFFPVAIKNLDCGVHIECPIQFEQGRKSAIHLLIDPSGDDLFVGVFEACRPMWA